MCTTTQYYIKLKTAAQLIKWTLVLPWGYATEPFKYVKRYFQWVPVCTAVNFLITRDI